jgi:hypothetical protein
MHILVRIKLAHDDYLFDFLVVECLGLGLLFTFNHWSNVDEKL